MARALRLGVSTSCFMGAMPPDLVNAAYSIRTRHKQNKLSEQQNQAMVEFMRQLMDTLNSTREVEAVECYHSTAYDCDRIVEVMLEVPNVEFWSIHGPYGRYADPSSPEDEAREGAVNDLLNASDIACRVGAGVVVAHPGANVEYDVTKQTRLELAVETFKRAADGAGELGVKIAIEPLPKQEPGNSLDEVLWMIERIDRPNVGINFDVNHLFPASAIPSFIRRAGELILSTHISDQDDNERHWLPFRGKLNWTEVLNAFTDVGYSGPLVYETHLKEFDNCDDVAREIVANYEKLVGLVRN